MPDGRLLSVFLEAGVVPRDSRDDNHNQLGEDLSRYLVVRPGDIVFNKLRSWQGGIGVSQYDGIVSPAYYVCHPGTGWYSRFLHYLLRSKPYLTEITRISKWMPPSQFDTPWDLLRCLPVLTPPLEEQRRIADFLDAETSRIDRVHELHGRVGQKLTERHFSLVDAALRELAKTHAEISFRRVVRRIEQGHSPECDAAPASNDEWAVLKLSSIKRGIFNGAENKLLPSNVRPMRRAEVHPGDLLITRANTPDLVGDSAVADDTSRMRLLPDLIYRVVLNDDIDPRFASIAINGGRIRSLIQSVARGSSQSMVKLRGEDIRQWPMPLPPLDVQLAFVQEVEDNRRLTDGLRHKINRQLALLAERRQALITAAVTGQLDVTTARSGVRA
ncbi:hypothetical protein [Prauserella sp. PE36]|uniref:restriction endonuclease subunit S n=1 Tax=Prauserella sp. PE36 TaxID=1504709 RepID=UPI0011BE3FF5|nr:hypothetical protein [Prauserella sp. PE36]